MSSSMNLSSKSDKKYWLGRPKQRFPRIKRTPSIRRRYPMHPAIRNFFANWRQPMPLRTKLRLGLRNTWYKVSHVSACCGRPGEPGC